ncbi:kinase-like protein [Calocera cornea HHB12733]|uniref:Kinase-like protein n=1 Tax=Calocera cornea HHB12733 TaxID=1353952 RepID=A0A165EI94_9BASI|nr:kinase-like protein [Calocera cornea HHB12733]
MSDQSPEHILLRQNILGADDMMPRITNISSLPVSLPNAFGDVWFASYDDTNVALKVIRVLAKTISKGRLEELVKQLKRWTELRHPNVLTPFGICENKLGIAIVWPWTGDSGISKYLAQYPMYSRASLVLDVARGLEYLHAQVPAIVHGDLRLPNILVQRTGQACLTDYGLSPVMHGMPGIEESDFSPSQSHVRWMAPERLYPESYGLKSSDSFTPASDIFAFGMVVYQLYAGRVPFHETQSAYGVFYKITIVGERPAHPGREAEERGLCDDMWAILEDCWKANGTDRPTSRELVERLERITAGQIPATSSLAQVQSSSSPDESLLPENPDPSAPVRSLFFDDTLPVVSPPSTYPTSVRTLGDLYYFMREVLRSNLT